MKHGDSPIHHTMDDDFLNFKSHELLVTQDGPERNLTIINMPSCPTRKPMPMRDRKK